MAEKVKQTSNAQRPTPNTEVRTAPAQLVGRSTFDIRRLLWRLLELLIGAVFVYAGVLKALDPVGFANDIENYHLLPWAIGVRLAFYLPWLEIFCGIALCFGKGLSGSSIILGGLTLVFIFASISAKARGIDVSCGCFGHAARNLSFGTHLAIDVLILAAALALFLRQTRDAA